MRNAGKVYLVGAGPGHPELLTIKAAELLKTADLVIYDRLIQQEVLALTRSGAERIYMGKPVDRHDSRQQEVNELMVRKAREGNMVVRLKGGDPFLFGRGGEEAEFLADHGIPFEVIPGVCSALSAPLSAGIAVTHREHCSAVAIVTGHQSKDDHLDWEALSRVDTLVFLMAVHNLGEITARLIAAGRSPDTPAAIIQMAFWHDEKVVTGTLATIADMVQREAIKPPATIVIGDVVRLREKLLGAQRDLARAADDCEMFAPGPLADQVFSLASGAMGTQVLTWSLEHQLFDHLERALPVCDLAHALRVNEDALDELLRVLVSLGFVESRRDGYRNLEIASRYLTANAPCGLSPALLYRARLTGGHEALDYFVRSGQKARSISDVPLEAQAHETLARFAAPHVVDRLRLDGGARVLLIGWGSDAYRAALGKRWPDATLTVVNPVMGDKLEVAPQSFDMALVSGALGSMPFADGERVLEKACRAVSAEGQLVIHDDLLSAGASVSPATALFRLARRIANGVGADWSIERLEAALERYAMRVTTVPLPSAGALALASRLSTNSLFEHDRALSASAH
jgi:uroporphyrin-III C-methyltransferase